LEFPTASEVVAAHARILRRFGGEPGVLTLSPVHAALARARHGPFLRGDLAERAAFLVRGIGQDHPFADGNKRTAYAVVDAFLRRNRHALAATPEEGMAFMLEVARGERDVEDVAEWLRSRLEKVYPVPVQVEPDGAEAEVVPGGARREP
jgi:death-on-curing protein